MISGELVSCIEEAFANVDRPSPEEMAVEGGYIDQSFLLGIGSRRWQELRPLRNFVGDGGEIALLSPKAYLYYIPAYLVALVNESGEEFYLNGVLDSLWYEKGRPVRDDQARGLLDPRRGITETVHALEIEMPGLTDQERKNAAEVLVVAAAKLDHLKRVTGHDSFDESSLSAALRVLWEERIPLLTGLQKRCIARLLVHILERTKDWLVAPRIHTALDAYWGTFLDTPGDR
jgi:hypothetical protein